jgi:hypothetical protein
MVSFAHNPNLNEWAAASMELAANSLQTRGRTPPPATRKSRNSAIFGRVAQPVGEALAADSLQMQPDGQQRSTVGWHCSNKINVLCRSRSTGADLASCC